MSKSILFKSLCFVPERADTPYNDLFIPYFNSILSSTSKAEQLEEFITSSEKVLYQANTRELLYGNKREEELKHKTLSRFFNKYKYHFNVYQMTEEDCLDCHLVVFNFNMSLQFLLDINIDIYNLIRFDDGITIMTIKQHEDQSDNYSIHLETTLYNKKDDCLLYILNIQLS